MTAQDFDRSLMALAAWVESDGGTVEEAICIARTIWNLSQREEISVGRGLVLHRELHNVQSTDQYPDPRDPKFVRLLQRIDDIGSVYAEDTTNGATYYADLSRGEPAWLRDRQVCAVSGRFHFFR